MTDEQLERIKKHFDELHIAATGLNPNVPDEIVEAMKAAYVAGADYALEMFAPHWISVEDELPPKEFDDRYTPHSIEVLGFEDGNIDRVFYDFECNCWLNSDFCNRHPSHWAYLPQPPKKGE